MVKERNGKLTREALINIFGWNKDKYIANSLLTEEDNNKIKKMKTID